MRVLDVCVKGKCRVFVSWGDGVGVGGCSKGCDRWMHFKEVGVMDGCVKRVGYQGMRRMCVQVMKDGFVKSEE